MRNKHKRISEEARGIMETERHRELIKRKRERKRDGEN